jgi:Flp pilus assembly protein TadB
MKKAILTLALIMSIGATQVSLASSAPKHRYHPTTQQVDKQASPAAAKQEDKQAAAGQASAAQDDEAIAAYSDTTATDTSDYADVDDNDNRSYHSKYSLGNYDDPFDFIGSVFGGGALSVIIIFCIIFGLLFVFAPLIIVFLVIRYLIRRHNDRMKLAEMAMEKGINVPESDRPIDKQSIIPLPNRWISRLLLLQQSRKISRLQLIRHPQLRMMRRLLPILIPLQRILPTMLM